MSKNLTYTLNNFQGNPDSFYADLSSFTDSILSNPDFETECYVNDFRAFIKKERIETLRSQNEYIVEFLMIGIYWQNYSGNASETGNIAKNLLKVLYKQRKKFPQYKAKIDKLRGCLAYLFLEKHKQTHSESFNCNGLNRLLNWLSASGEFNEEVLRLRNWMTYSKIKDENYIAALIKTAVKFSEKFSEQAKYSLGKYVENLAEFHQKSKTDYKYREDYFFVNRSHNEYFLNMFAAEILNRELKKNFIKTSKKVVLLPTCMRNEPAKGCKAKSDGKELVCTSCWSECNIGKVSAEMKKLGTTTYLIPHSSEFSKFLVKWKDVKDTSLIGVACVLNLIAGGYEMKRLNISSQCVFLDYCGCKKHWDKEGFPTSLNLNQLKKIVEKPTLKTELQSLILV